MTDPKKANVLILPYKFKGLKDGSLTRFLELSEKYNIPLLAFYIDDDESSYDLPKNLHLWRTSIIKNTKHANEHAMPAFTADYFNSRYLCVEEQSIGYCGHTEHGRETCLSGLEQSQINCNFIRRSDFWAAEVNNKYQAKLQFIENLERSMQTDCFGLKSLAHWA